MKSCRFRKLAKLAGIGRGGGVLLLDRVDQPQRLDNDGTCGAARVSPARSSATSHWCKKQWMAGRRPSASVRGQMRGDLVRR